MRLKHVLLAVCASLALSGHMANAKDVKIGMAIDDLRLKALAERPRHLRC